MQIYSYGSSDYAYDKTPGLRLDVPNKKAFGRPKAFEYIRCCFKAELFNSEHDLVRRPEVIVVFRFDDLRAVRHLESNGSFDLSSRGYSA